MSSVKPLYWHQGLFLQPQHFQQMQLQVEASARAYTNVKTGADSGISTLIVDEESLKNGVFAINAIDCVLSDGTLLSFPGNTTLGPISLTAVDADSTGKYEIFLALAPLESQMSNLSEATEGATRRYRLNDVSNVADMFDQQESVDLTTLNFDAKLLLGRDAAQKSNMIVEKIAEIIVDGGQFIWSPKYIANVNFVQASTVLRQSIRSIRQGLIARYEQLESFGSLTGGHMSELSSANLANILAKNVIAAYVPMFSHFEDVTTTSPQQVYLSLRQLIAQLSTFSNHVSVTGETNDAASDLLPYQSGNLGECFSRAFTLVNHLLDELTIDPELLVSLVEQGDGKYVSGLSAEFIDTGNRVYMRLRTSSNIERNVADIIQHAKFGADGQVDIYMKRSLPGIGLRYLPRKPMGVASTPNSYYFTIERSGFEWQKLVDSSRAGLIWSDAPGDLVVEIIAVKG